MTAFAAIIGGGTGGLAGAAVAHVLVTFANRFGAETWLKGQQKGAKQKRPPGPKAKGPTVAVKQRLA